MINMLQMLIYFIPSLNTQGRLSKMLRIASLVECDEYNIVKCIKFKNI